MKKRILLSIVLSFICIPIAGCNIGGCEISTYYAQGVDVEKFRPDLSSIGTTSYLIPKTFLEDFEYTENKFYRYTNEHGLDFGDIDKNLIYLGYSDEVYKEAKVYILTEMDLDLSNEKIYNGYTFYLNYAREHANGGKVIFPYQYLMAGYNDANNRIIFLSINCSSKVYPEAEQGLTDFGLYLKTFFGDFYDFEA